MRSFLLAILMLFGFITTSVSAQSNWKTILTFKGSSSQDTDDFEIKHKKWRISWEANKQYDELYGGNFIVTIVDSQDEEDLVINALIPDEGETIIRKSGKFYFKITSLFTDWVMKIQIPSNGGE